MDYRLPYYMAYPMPLQYEDDRTERYDFEYMKSMYPNTAKRLLVYVEDECDRMEYEGSMMYDEYPDQLQMRLMCGRIYDRVMELEPDILDGETEGMEAATRNPVRDLIEVLLFQEFFRRRSDQRRRMRRFY